MADLDLSEFRKRSEFIRNKYAGNPAALKQAQASLVDEINKAKTAHAKLQQELNKAAERRKADKSRKAAGAKVARAAKNNPYYATTKISGKVQGTVKTSSDNAHVSHWANKGETVAVVTPGRGKSRPPSKPLVVRAKNNLGNYRLRLASYTAATNARGISRPDINRSTLTVKTTSNAAVASALSKATYAFEKHLETSSNLFLKQTKKRLTEETRESLKAGHLDAIKGGKGSLGIMNGLNRLVDTHKNAYISYVHSLSGVLETGLNVHPNGSASNKVTASVLGQQITAYGAFHKLTEYTMDAKKALGTQRLWKHTGELATAFKASVSAQNLNKQSFFDASSVKSSEDSVTFKLSIPEWKDPNARAQAFVNEIIPKAYKGGFEGIREADSMLTHAVRQFADKIKSEKLVSNKALGISGTSFKHLLKKGKRK